MSSDFNSPRVELSPALESLRQLGGVVSPAAQELGRHLVERLSRHTHITPAGFLLASTAMANDIIEGQDSLTGQPIETGLPQNDDSYYELLTSTAELASRIFPGEFALKVTQAMVERNLLPAPEAAHEQTLSKGEIITEPITDIYGVQEQILDDAKERVLALDWARFGELPDDIDSLLVIHGSVTLRNGPLDLPLNLFREEDVVEKEVIESTAFDKKFELPGGGYWVCMGERLLPHEAMMLRDHLFLKGVEMTADLMGLDPIDTTAQFATDINGPLSRAANRLKENILGHPELLR
jgi:hypothetical protein